MALDKLFSECERCEGTGFWTRPTERAGNSTRSFSPEECSDCEGVGKIPTSDGAQILDLINTWRSRGKLR